MAYGEITSITLDSIKKVIISFLAWELYFKYIYFWLQFSLSMVSKLEYFSS